MLTGVPYNVNVPEFQPERSAPVFPVVTRKYPCTEDVVQQDYARFNTLTWKIQQPDQSMVWQSVKLVLPLEMKAYRSEGIRAPANQIMPHANAELDMRVTSRRPACNIAVAESPMGAFRQSSLTINGRIFSEVNDYRRILDACYRGTGPSSYGANHSLKPLACRDIFSPLVDSYPVTYLDQNGEIVQVEHDDGSGNTDVPVIVTIQDEQHRVLDNGFSLLEHNGPFIERARKFQDELSFDGKTWTGLITNYLELGPFQARARVSNTAVPYIRDLHLRLNFDTNPSRYDSKIGSGMSGLPVDVCRTIPAKLFEFATIPTLSHHGETQLRTSDFIAGMKLKYTAKPYLEVQYVRYIEPMKSFYNLRCFDYQYEQSNPFPLEPPVGTRVSPTSVQRVTSRLLSYPTKVYLYASLSDAEQNPYIMGNVRRSCLLKNIHCRLNQRPDVIFNPSQEECYQMFRRHTNSSLEYGAWLKAPIYCFDPVDLGQPDFLANDARLCQMEWDAEVSLTPLQQQEMTAAKNSSTLMATGYSKDLFSYKDDLVTHTGDEMKLYWWEEGRRDLQPDTAGYSIRLEAKAVAQSAQILINRADVAQLTGMIVQFRNRPTDPVCPTTEMFQLGAATGSGYQARGFLWGKMDNTRAIAAENLWWVPTSYQFMGIPANSPSYVNDWAIVTTTVANNAESYQVAAGVNVFLGQVSKPGTMGVHQVRINAANAHAGAGQICPGPFAYLTDRAGIRNAAGGGALNPGRLAAGAQGYTVLDQRTNNDTKWVCFRPSYAMINGTGDDAQMVRWRVTNAGLTAGALTGVGGGHDSYVASGPFVKRDMGTGAAPPAHTDMRWERASSSSFPLSRVIMNTPSTHKFDYTLKALYEYGNSQYQFTSDGAPTKVLPNLVPVRDSSAIPIV